MLKLAPCPFCGGEAEFSIGKTGDGKDWHYIECGDCGALGPRVNYADHNIRVEEANAEAWNRRTSAPDDFQRGQEADYLAHVSELRRNREWD